MSDPNQDQPSLSSPSSQLRELAEVFLKLGATAFGGPAAHIAMMDAEIVSRRYWMSREKLLDLLGITNLIPGPNSTELAIHIGYERAGWQGLVVAGTCFILPATLMVWLLAAIYVRYQTVPQMIWLLYGIKPVIIAVVLQALWKLGQKAAKDPPTVMAGIAAAAGFLAGINEIALLLAAGIAVMLIKPPRTGRSNLTGAFLLPILAQTGGAGLSATASVGWGSVFLFFLKIGSVLYGSGYVLLAFLQRDWWNAISG
jgi:chromate transporter